MSRAPRRKRAGQPPLPADASLRPDESFEALLEDVRDLRLTLAADLAAVAAATELGAEDIAADIMDADRRELAAFSRRAIARLRALDEQSLADTAVVTPEVASGTPRWRRRALITLPAVPLAGALAMSAAAAMGVLPGQHSTAHPTQAVAQPSAPVSSTFQEFATVVSGDPSASQVVAAASALHAQIAELIATAPENPSGVREVAQLLQMEQALLLRKLPPGSTIVLAQSRRLAARLLSVTTSTAPSTAPMPTPTSTHTTAPKPETTTSSSPKSTTTHTTKSSPTPTATPSSSPSSSDSPGHLPTIGN